jgi:outer membrane lipopolysaccharide assembly protein LptE/RlpB
MNPLSKTLIALLLFCLTGCGFRLISTHQFSPAFGKVYVAAHPGTFSLLSPLKSHLTQSGVVVARSKNSADLVLDLLSVNKSSSNIGDSNSQLTRSYTLTYSATFSLSTLNGKIIVAPAQSSSQSTLYVYRNHVIGNDNETSNAYYLLSQDVTNNIINRLNTDNVRQRINAIKKGK